MSAPFTDLSIEFVGSFPDPMVRLQPVLPEIALIGRSNVGKSSLLNSLVGRPIARVSGAPGKTTLLNAYRLPSFYLVDLPGYGFARAGKSARAGYQSLVRRYLRQRATLAGVVWLLDIRHPPSKDDREFQELLAESERRVLAVLTKSDKLPRGQRMERVRALARELELPDDQVQPTSSQSGEGVPELAEAMLLLAKGAANERE
ncbi:MAG: ribosome biogenesis GTP-binding protein YihA/YsxC [Gemmatimonadales bacterium]